MKTVKETIADIKALPTYEITETRWIEELHSEAILGRHRKSGARIFLLSNDDNNKVFTIGFRTPPVNDTGVPHILEHSVLSGSRKFPLKDPFVELMKGSLNTFLNAMTYPDKTVYPVASCNDKDFQNLMDVYMDAVLHPNVLENDKIFLQEGWHYHLEKAEDPIVVNGVVYNEMKGAYSSPEEMLNAHQNHALFPDTCYGKDSGGDPGHIPELSYEEFKAFYHRYYHPCNSYIYLYGDMDMAEKLAWLDREYLAEYDAIEIDSHIEKQAAFEQPVTETFFYPLTEEEEEEGQTYLSWNAVVGDDLDPKLYVAFQILDYALINAPGAPVKQALLDAGIGKDVMGGYNNGILQPYFNVTAKETDPDRREAFVKTIKDTLTGLADDGIDPKSLQAGLNYYEFRYREADYGSLPRGLMYGLWCFDSWLYDETDPLMHIAYADTFAWLKQEMDKGYFEGLIRQYLLDNPHEAVVAAIPKKGLGRERDAAQAEKMAAFKASLTGEELETLVRKTGELKAYQEEADGPELLRKLPLLSREDIRRTIQPFQWTESETSGVKVLHHDLFTSGIGYLRLLFDTEAVADEEIPYLGFLSTALGYMNTEKYDYRELFHEIYIQTGGISTGINTYSDAENPDRYRGMFEVSAKTFYDKLDFTMEMIGEILLHTRFRDEKRLREILAETKSRSQMHLISAGNRAAVTRAGAYYSEKMAFGELTGGIAYYKFIEELDDHFEEKKDELAERLEQVARKIFSPDHLIVSYTADQEGFAGLEEPLTRLIGGLYEGGRPAVRRNLIFGKKNEGFLTSSNVQYVAQCGSYRMAGYSYTGAMQVLRCILNYDYLWLELRAKGGAYGCGCTFYKSGEGGFYSYRDPHLKKSLQVYQGIPDYVRSFDVDEREMTKYIIGAVSEIDTPLNPAAKGARSLTAFLTHTTEESVQRERNQVLDAQPEDIRLLAPALEAILEQGNICVVGNAEKCREDASALKELKNLFAKEKENK